MSRHTKRRRVRINDLTDELAVGTAMRLRCNSDDIRHVVAAVVAYLVEEYPAQDLYIPASLTAANYPVRDMRRAVEAGDSVREVCRRFRVDRRTLYRLIEESPAND